MDDDTTKVILVDEKDNQIGIAEKLDAHSNGGKLHRAMSLFIFNSSRDTMLQKRASTKYHSQSQWTNTCCGHPYPGESVGAAAHRRLREEMGFDCEMKEAFSFTYHADVGNGLRENEFDHVFFGVYDGAPRLNPEEADDYRWISLQELKTDMEGHPEEYTPWLKLVLDRVIENRK